MARSFRLLVPSLRWFVGADLATVLLFPVAVPLTIFTDVAVHTHLPAASLLLLMRYAGALPDQVAQTVPANPLAEPSSQSDCSTSSLDIHQDLVTPGLTPNRQFPTVSVNLRKFSFDQSPAAFHGRFGADVPRVRRGIVDSGNWPCIKYRGNLKNDRLYIHHIKKGWGGC